MRAVVQLARVEAVRLLRSPALLVGAVLEIASSVFTGWSLAPAWPLLVANISSSSIYLAAGAAIATQFATSRQRRRAMADTFRVLPVDSQQRTLALLGSAVTVAAVACAAVCVIVVWQLAWPAGQPSWSELLVAVVLPVLGAAGGVLIGRWVPRRAGLVIAVCLALSPVLGGIVLVGTVDGPARWLSPIVPDFALLAEPPRPANWHLFYLVALVAVVGGVAALRDAPRRLPAVAVAVALAAAAGSFVMQVRASPRLAPEVAYLPSRVGAASDCERRRDVTYCAYRGYRGWVGYWQDAVQPVVDAVPPGRRAALPVVRQARSYLITTDPSGGREVYTAMLWGRGSFAADFRAELASAYSAAVVGLPGDGLLATAQDVSRAPCTLPEQARVVVALWLAAQSLPDGLARLREHRLELVSVAPGQREIDTVAAMLALPRERVTAALDRDWNRTIAAATPIESLAGLGLPVAPAVPVTFPVGAPARADIAVPCR